MTQFARGIAAAALIGAMMTGGSRDGLAFPWPVDFEPGRPCSFAATCDHARLDGVRLRKAASPAAEEAGSSDLLGPIIEDLNTSASPKARVQQILEDIRQYRLEVALDKAQALARDHPDLAIPLHLQGLVLWAKGDRAAALETLREARTLAPEDPGLSYDLGRFLRIDNQLERAQEVVNEGLEANPTSSRLRLEAARLAGARNDSKEMQARLEHLLDADRSVLEARLDLVRLLMLQGRPGEAVDVARSAPQTQQSSPPLLEVLGQAQLADGRADQAATTFERLAKAVPKEAGAHRHAGRAHLLAGDPDAGVAHLETAQRLAPESKETRLLLAEAYIRTRQGRQAGQLIDELEADHPQDAEVMALRGRYAFAVQGDPQAAQQAYQKALERSPSEDIAVTLARIELHNRDVAGALETLEGWSKTHPKARQAREALAEIQLQRGAYGEANQVYRELLGLVPGHPGYLNNLSWSLAQAGSLDEALQFAEQAARSVPDDPSIQDTLGMILMRKGQYADATDHLARAFEMAPKRAEIRFNYVEALIASGQSAKARKLLQEVSTSQLRPLMQDRRRALQTRLDSE